MESTPLNGAKYAPAQNENDSAVSNNSTNNIINSTANSDFTSTPPRKKHVPVLNSTQRKNPTIQKSCLKQTVALDNYVITNKAVESDYGALSRDKKTAAALKKAERPRKSYAHQVNGRVSFKSTPPPCDCDVSNGAIVR